MYKKIPLPSIKLEILSKDIKNNIRINKEYIERSETIIIFGNKSNLNLMNNEDYIEYFIDGMFKLIPKKYKPNKIL